MPRQARVAPGGLVYHVLNRSVAGLPRFRKEADYEAFTRIMIKAILSEWPVERPRRWTTRVKERLTAKEQEAIQTSLARNRPYVDEAWQEEQAKRLGLLHTLRREGRPTKKQKAT